MKAPFFFLIVLCHISCQELRPPFSSENFDLHAVSEGVYSGIHKLGGRAICNIGIIDLGDETLIFDNFLDPGSAAEIHEVVKTEQLSPINYVVNSHYHNDHIRGNQVFSDEVKIISTTRTKELIAENEPKEIEAETQYAPNRFQYYDSLYKNFVGDRSGDEFAEILMWRPYYKVLSESKEVVKTKLPTQMLDSIQTIVGSNKKIILISKGQGHTESDLVLYMPEEKVLFAGDLIFNQYHPYLGHGNLVKWKLWLDYLDSLDIQTIIPGHGPMGNKSLIMQMKSYIEDLEGIASEVSQMGDNVDVTSVNMPEKYKSWRLGRFFTPNLLFALESLKDGQRED